MTRFDAITSAFLRYLYEDNHFRPPVAGFFDSQHAATDPRVAIEELHRVMTALVHHELIVTGDPDPETGIPERAGLTGAGLICVDHHDADVEQWAGLPPSALPRDCGELTPERSGGEIVQPRSAPEQPEQRRHALAGLVRVARVLLLTLPSVHTGDISATEVHQAAKQLLDCAATADPNAWEARQLAQRLRDELATGPVANTLGVVLLDGLDDALRETDLQLTAPHPHRG